MRIDLRNPHASHAFIGDANLFSRALREIEAPTVNKRTSIVDAHLHRAACGNVGHPDGRADPQTARRCRKVVGIVGLATGCRLTSRSVALIRGRDGFRFRAGFTNCGLRRWRQGQRRQSGRRSSRERYGFASRLRLGSARCHGHCQAKADRRMRDASVDWPIAEHPDQTAWVGWSIVPPKGPNRRSRDGSVRLSTQLHRRAVEMGTRSRSLLRSESLRSRYPALRS